MNRELAQPKKCFNQIFKMSNKFFHGAGLYKIETNLLIFFANQWTGFYVTETFDMKKLIKKSKLLSPSIKSVLKKRTFKKIKSNFAVG